ncbi:flagellar FliJ family protein [Pontiellaceae bacterium B1224]|nr:flagellar FliJ family protein [Pontiellaceae bacterium B1224]
MKKFSFSFQYLLDVHSAKEQAAECALQKAVAALEDAERALKAIVEAGARQTKVIEQMTGVVQYTDYAIHRRNIDYIQEQMSGYEKACRSQADVVEECRVLLRKEVTSRRILENLCKREQSEWADALQNEEQKQMDELAVVRWSRQEIRK